MTYNTIFKIYISIFISVIVTIIAISGITFLGTTGLFQTHIIYLILQNMIPHFHSAIFIPSIKHLFYFSL